jgi:hypothetical protein
MMDTYNDTVFLQYCTFQPGVGISVPINTPKKYLHTELYTIFETMAIAALLDWHLRFLWSV